MSPPGREPPASSFRPRIGGRGGEVKGGRVPTFNRAVMRRIERMAGSTVPGLGGKARGHQVRDVRAPAAQSRRCLVKARYVQMTAYGSKAGQLHISYIEREGVERDGTKGRLFDHAGDVDRAAFSASLEGERRQFRFIISPENGADLDLRQYTRDLVGRMEADLERPLRWAAVCHYNTDNPHVHLVVRGLDRDGQDLRIPKRYMAQGIRARAQEIATIELGPRSREELQLQTNREVTQERFTSLDRTIESALSPGLMLDMRSGAPRGASSRTQLLARLEKLEGLQLATRTSPTSWAFAEGWQTTLKTLGERGDILHQIHSAVRGDPARYRVFNAGDDGQVVEGVLRRKGLQEDLGHDLYGVVETERGIAYYVRLPTADVDQVSEGDLVRVRSVADSWAKPADRVLAQVAAQSDGIYDPAVHGQQLASRDVVIAGQRTSPADVIAANIRRLARLERHGLVTRLDGDRWRVPADLVEQLKMREQQSPQHRVRVERLGGGLHQQVSYPGPTWLDQPGAREGHAPYGFGSQARIARQDRARTLSQLGIDPSSPNRAAALEALEVRTIGERAAAALGFEYRPATAGFRGRAVTHEADPSPSGRKYIQVIDEAARTLTVIPTTEGRNFQGAKVEVIHERSGRFVVRSRDLERGL